MQAALVSWQALSIFSRKNWLQQSTQQSTNRYNMFCSQIHLCREQIMFLNVVLRCFPHVLCNASLMKAR